MPGYPTREEILKRPRPKHRRDVLAFVHEWKRVDWRVARRGDQRCRFESIRYLTQRIATMYDRPVSVSWTPDRGWSSFYDGTIVLVGNPSIITALHELGHHLFGRSERQACRWSVWLFRKTFPLAYAALVWRGHLLVRTEPDHPALEWRGHALVRPPQP